MVFPWFSQGFPMVFAIFPLVFPWFWRPKHSPPRPGDVVAVEVEGIGRLENTMLGGRGQSAIISGDYY
jgi:hypothetical protein